MPLRVITTSLGATDARALDALVDEFGAEVRIAYDAKYDRILLRPASYGCYRRSRPSGWTAGIEEGPRGLLVLSGGLSVPVDQWLLSSS